MAEMATREERCENGKNAGKGKNSGAYVRFAEIERGDQRNAVISTEQTDRISEENDVDIAYRDVLTPKTISAKS